MEISCSECGSYSVHPTTQPDEEGYVEYHCADCGHYFVEVAVEASPCEDTAVGLPLALNRAGCCFPSQCLMPGPHLMSECHTVEMYEAAMRDLEDEGRPILAAPDLPFTAEQLQAAVDRHAAELREID